MNKYIVHIYREMRLSYADIEADTPEAAAAIASGKPTDEADTIDDCEGQNLAALVDLAGDEDYSQSVMIDFEAERIRKAAPKLLAAMKAVLPYAWNERASLRESWKRDDDQKVKEELEACDRTLDQATAVIGEAESAGIQAAATADKLSQFEIEHNPVENPDRAYVMVDGKFDVAIIRTGEGIVIDVYPKDWIDPIDTMTVWDDDVADCAETEDDHTAAEV